MYLHEMAEPEASFTKEEMQLGKHTEYEKRLISYYLDIIAKEKEKKKLELNDKLSDNNKCNNRKIIGNNTNFVIESNGFDETSNDSVIDFY